jgi:Concanavalin A-like lectin/glucanases superfamily/FecR protein
MTPEEFRTLVDAALEGAISEADFLRLEAELSIDPRARREYFDSVMLTALLEAEASGQVEQRVNPVRNVGTTNFAWRTAFVAAAAICASLLVFIAWQSNHRSESKNSAFATESVATAGNEQQSSGFAILSGETECEWGSGKLLALGGIVAPGELHLRNGVAQFELFSGVTLVVEGEAKFSILSPMVVSVASGKVRARVPMPAHGFRMLTGAGEVVDLGTEFAVNVSAEQAEVHVLEGEIEWHPTGLPSRRLTQGEATLVNSQGDASMSSDPQAFIGTEEIQRRIRQSQLIRRDAWIGYCQTLANDDRLIAHYRFISQAATERLLPNLAAAGDALASEGAVVAAAPVQNRWSDLSSALDFSPAGSRVRVHVPGEHHNLSLVCWVRINSLDRWYNSLFLTDGHDQGEPHWQIMDDGRLFFSVKKNDEWDATKGEKDKHIFFSPPFWNASMSGRWLMLATVYNGDKREVMHYLNGEVLSQESIPDDFLVSDIRIGDASLCNWGLPERDQPKFAIRNLNGSMDEFLMYSAPLSTEEIRKLYDASKP